MILKIPVHSTRPQYGCCLSMTHKCQESAKVRFPQKQRRSQPTTSPNSSFQTPETLTWARVVYTRVGYENYAVRHRYCIGVTERPISPGLPSTTGYQHRMREHPSTSFQRRWGSSKPSSVSHGLTQRPTLPERRYVVPSHTTVQGYPPITY